ncbi:MAG TPA: DUF4157 domain-containing protein [Myxococcota bacterium]|nr:DUF4157 domain-containing protein [Myxococcota bacterium]
MALARASTGSPESIGDHLLGRALEYSLSDHELLEIVALLREHEPHLVHRMMRCGWRDRSTHASALAAAIRADLEPTAAPNRLPGPLRHRMEAALGIDLSTVEVREAPEATALGALAFTRGDELVFAPGHYRPDTRAGLELLGHELVHVAQQRAGRVRPGALDADPRLEAEADQLGARAVRGEVITSFGSTSHSGIVGLQLKSAIAQPSSLGRQKAGAFILNDATLPPGHPLEGRREIELTITQDAVANGETTEQRLYGLKYIEGFAHAYRMTESGDASPLVVKGVVMAELRADVKRLLDALAERHTKEQAAAAEELATLGLGNLESLLASTGFEPLASPLAEKKHYESDVGVTRPTPKVDPRTIAIDGSEDVESEGRPAPREETPGATVTDSHISLDHRIEFGFDDATLLPTSLPPIEAVVAVLRDNPDIERVRVEGHTDPVGKAAYNLDLSKRRADAVKNALVDRGIDAKRLETQGHGDTRPLPGVDPKSAEGRAQLRRVEFEIVKRATATPGNTPQFYRTEASEHPNPQVVAARGLTGGGDAFPYFEQIQDAFGDHDLSMARAHCDADAVAAARELRAEAYASGEHVAFARSPDLRLAAHEATHIIQQRAGVSLPGGVGQVGDRYEQHADAVAERVVRGQSAEDLLDGLGGGAASSSSAIQRWSAHEHRAVGDIAAAHASPAATVAIPTRNGDISMGEASEYSGDHVKAPEDLNELDEIDKKYLNMVWVAGTNINHFYPLCQNEYRAHHQKALAAAVDGDRGTALREEGFASHFLADCFAAGHQAPRALDRIRAEETSHPAAEHILGGGRSKVYHDALNQLASGIPLRGVPLRWHGDDTMTSDECTFIAEQAGHSLAAVLRALNGEKGSARPPDVRLPDGPDTSAILSKPEEPAASLWRHMMGSYEADLQSAENRSDDDALESDGGTRSNTRTTSDKMREGVFGGQEGPAPDVWGPFGHPKVEGPDKARGTQEEIEDFAHTHTQKLREDYHQALWDEVLVGTMLLGCNSKASKDGSREIGMILGTLYDLFASGLPDHIKGETRSEAATLAWHNRLQKTLIFQLDDVTEQLLLLPLEDHERESLYGSGLIDFLESLHRHQLIAFTVNPQAVAQQAYEKALASRRAASTSSSRTKKARR